MILADKIINERKKNGWSQEELAEQLAVSRQSISKWEGAQAIPDIQKIIKMAELFGVSTDYLLKDEMEPADAENVGVLPEDPDGAAGLRKVSLEEASEFLSLTERIAPRRANAVSACILAPALLILCIALAQIPGFPLGDKSMVAIGLTALFALIAVAVFFFVIDGMKLMPYSYLETEPIETMYGVSGMVSAKKNAFEQKRVSMIAGGVILCVASVIPLVVLAIVSSKEYLIILMVVVLMVMVAAGVNLLVRACTVAGAHQRLLQEGEYSVKAKARNPKFAKLSSVYWLAVTAGYLGWSFWGNHWAISWIIWPIAALVFACLSIALKED